MKKRPTVDRRDCGQARPRARSLSLSQPRARRQRPRTTLVLQGSAVAEMGKYSIMVSTKLCFVDEDSFV